MDTVPLSKCSGRPMIVVVMGVAGSGKTTIGRALARRLGGEFIEGDSFHPQSNIDRMRSGQPLSDDDRSIWLTRLSREIARRKSAGASAPTVLSCSALKKRYRARLREADRGRGSFILPDRRICSETLGPPPGSLHASDAAGKPVVHARAAAGRRVAYHR